MLYLSPSNYQTDIWSLGVLLFIMIYHKYPFGCHSRTKNMQLDILSRCKNGFDLDSAVKDLVKDPP